jgi:hypothetical protein
MRERFSLSVSVFIIGKDGEKILFLRRSNTGWKDGFHIESQNDPLRIPGNRAGPAGHPFFELLMGLVFRSEVIG